MKEIKFMRMSKIVFAILAFFFNFSFCSLLCNQKTVHATVFVHGTICSSLSFFGMNIVEQYRLHPVAQEDQVIGPLGLKEWSLHENYVDYANQATPFLLRAYDAVARQSSFVGDENVYATFGWSGYLSNRSRKEFGFKFYDALCDFRDELKNRYNTDEIVLNIVTHSHGGNVALFLPEVEQEKKKQLQVNMLYMMGPPIQVETAKNIESLLFKHVIQGFSDADSVQGIDIVSTRAYKSHKHMSALVDLKGFVKKNPHRIRCDMRYVVNKNSKHITHMNMWMMGRSKRVFLWAEKYPLMVLVPAFAKAVIDDGQYTEYVAHLDSNQEQCYVSLTAGFEDFLSKPKLHYSGNLYPILSQEHTVVESFWKPTDQSRNVILNRKNYFFFKEYFYKKMSFLNL